MSREVAKALGILSIKEMLSQQSTDEIKAILNITKEEEDLILKVQTERAEHELRRLINRTNDTLTKEVDKDPQDINRINQIDRSYKALLLIYGHIQKQSARIAELKNEIRLMNEKSN